VQTGSLAYRGLLLLQSAKRRHHLLAALNFDPAAEPKQQAERQKEISPRT
jgi:hypothetical protein